ncbi:MAG: preprotein translocase subunit SecE [Oscillospiraceae bacterium]|nr:preprotein translocase subunit SecE [Oscillospiraceae bacterium]MDD4367673.1 preprotein translocase subunit SecE [Oscillospiraceae bacterium]
MAKQDSERRPAAKEAAPNKKSAKINGKSKKPSVFKRMGKYFRELKAELKRVIWPGKEKMKQSAAVVLAIILASAVLIWIVDALMTQILTAGGFYSTTSSTTAATTAAVTETAETTADSQSTESADSSESVTVTVAETTAAATTGN